MQEILLIVALYMFFTNQELQDVWLKSNHSIKQIYYYHQNKLKQGISLLILFYNSDKKIGEVMFPDF